MITRERVRRKINHQLREVLKKADEKKAERRGQPAAKERMSTNNRNVRKNHSKVIWNRRERLQHLESRRVDSYGGVGVWNGLRADRMIRSLAQK